MNIAINARFLFSDQLEGVHRYIYETTFRMARAHPEDNFWLFYDRPFSKTLTYPDNVHQIVIPLQTRHPLLWHIWLEYLLPIYFKKFNIDVFYSGDSYMSLRARIPTVLVCHDLAYLHYPDHIPMAALWHYRKYFPKYHHKAERIIAVSESTKQDIIKQYNIDSSKIIVAPNAISGTYHIMHPEEKQIVRKEYTNGKPYFIYLGALHPRKNIVQLIRAFNQFKNTYKTAHQLVLAGRMAWKSSEIQLLIANNPDIYHTGFIDADEKKKILGGADALVYISLFEGFGIPLIEAMASGIPVITSSVSSMPEVVADAALLVDPTDNYAISEAMNSIISQPDLSKDLINKGLKRFKAYDWEKTASIIYNQIVSCVLS